MFRIICAFLVWLSGCATIVYADTQKDEAGTQAVMSLKAYAAYKSGDYINARQMWENLARDGNTTAMNNLANMYAQGQGVDQDYTVAADWLQKAAQAGDPVAQLNLGLAYERGHGFERDNKQAASWFRKAAQQGDRDAQFNLGVMLATGYGKGVEKSTSDERAEALRWLQAAHDSGHPEAKQMMAILQTATN